jgi:hypothetical protein
VNPIFVVAFVITAILRVICPAQKVGSSHHAVKKFQMLREINKTLSKLMNKRAT